MGILIDLNTKLIVQGITGRDGSFHTRQMLNYGTNVVGGVTPGKGGERVEGVLVYNSVDEAVRKTGANTSVIYVPAAFAYEAILEAVDGGIKLVVCITEGIPVNDALNMYNYIQGKDVRVIGPNCPGLLTPGKSKVGIMPGQIAKEGIVGIVSKSGTLTYEVVYAVTKKGLGQTTCIGIGGDPIIGTGFIDVLEMFNKDKETKGIALIGEIGGTDEEEAAAYIKENIKKPVVSFIAGRTAPEGKRMGHAGAIISGGLGTAESKIKALNAAGVEVCDTPSDIADILYTKL